MRPENSFIQFLWGPGISVHCLLLSDRYHGPLNETKSVGSVTGAIMCSIVNLSRFSLMASRMKAGSFLGDWTIEFALPSTCMAYYSPWMLVIVVGVFYSRECT